MPDKFGGRATNILLDRPEAAPYSDDTSRLGGRSRNILFEPKPVSVPFVATPTLPSSAYADHYTDLYQGIKSQAYDPTEYGQDAYNRNLKLAADMDQANRGAIRGSAPYRVTEDILSASADAVVSPLLWAEGKLGIDAATDMKQQRQADYDIAHLRDRGWTEAMVGGMGESIGKFVTLSLASGGVAGLAGLGKAATNALKWTGIGAGLAEKSYATTYRDQLKDNKTPEEAHKIALATSAIEVGTMGVFQKIGLGGVEGAIFKGLGTESAKASARMSLQGLKNFGVLVASELAEEEITTLGQSLAQTGGVGGWQQYVDTAVATLGTAGLLSGSQKLINFVSKPTRQTAKDAGLGSLGRTQKGREEIADTVLLAAAKKVNTDWVQTNTPEQAAAEAAATSAAEAGSSVAVAGVEPAATESPVTPPPLSDRDEKILGELTKRLKRKLRSSGFRQDEMGVIVDNFQAWYRQRGHEKFKPGVRTEDVTTNAPESPAPASPEVEVVGEPQVAQPAATPDPNLTTDGTATSQFASGIPLSAETGSLFRRMFISGGNQDPLTRKLVFRRDSIMRKHNAKVMQGTRDLRREVARAKRASGVAITDEQLNQALADPTLIPNLPPKVGVEVQKVRDHIDSLSDQIQMLGGITPDMFLTIEGNKGSYITRSYRKFDDIAGWRKQALNDPQIMADFAAEVRGPSPNATDAEIRSLAEELLRRDTLRPTGLTSGSSTQNYVKILEKRKDLSPAIRQLYGENKGIFDNYAMTVGQMSSTIAHRGFIENLVRDGLAAGVFSQAGGVRNQPDHVQEVSHDAIPQLAPLKGILMPEDLAVALNDLYAMPGAKDFGKWFATASGLVKAAKTVGAFPRAFIRNLAGNIPITIANGNWNALRFAAAGKSTLMEDLLNQGSPAQQAAIERMKELGVVESFSMEEIRDAARHGTAAARSFVDGVTVGPVKAGAKKLARLYAAMDTVAKIHNYQSELATLQKAHPGRPLFELEEEAAKITRALNPTYGEASKAAKWWSRYAPLGSFAMFSAEMLRTTGNRLNQAAGEIRSGNPTLVAQGMKRLAGQGIALVMMGAMRDLLERYFDTKMTDEQDKAMRQNVPSWQKHSQLLVTKVDEHGNPIAYADLGYNDPFGIFNKTMRAAAYGSREDAITQVAEPFFSEDILAGALLSVWRGRDENDQPIADRGLSEFEQNKQIMEFMAKKAEPGAVTSGKRLLAAWNGETTRSGVPLDFNSELMSNLGGMRIERFDRDVSSFYRNRAFDEQVKASQTAVRKVFLNKGTFDVDAARQVYIDANATRQQTMKDWKDYVEGTRILGEENPFGKVVRDIGQESIVAQQMYSGNHTPYRFSEDDFGRMRKLPQGEERIKLIQDMIASESNQ